MDANEVSVGVFFLRSKFEGNSAIGKNTSNNKMNWFESTPFSF